MTLTADRPSRIRQAAEAAAVYRTEPARQGRPDRTRTLVHILNETARLHPGAPAIDDGTRELSYRKLADEVAALRSQLVAAGIGRGDRVGIRMSSGTAELYIAILATLSAGAAYVPVDADDPDERASVVFAEAEVAAVFRDGYRLVSYATPEGQPGTPSAEDDAWIIFTSGSTGKPKGVAVSHAAAAAFVDAEAELFLAAEPLGPGDRVLAGLSVAFDASCEEMWLAWRNGACLVPAPRSLVRTGVDLGPWLLDKRISVVSTVPTLAALWPVDALDDVRLLIFGGEACPPELGERLAVEDREVWNTYGPTEATVVSCAARLTGDEPVRIGLPLAGWQLAVVDEQGEPVSMGGTGELVIGGAGLARYLDPAKDSEKFAALPSLGWSRAYRSGDVVRADPEGLVFVGRADEQIKLGGRRIELGEVDAALQALPDIAGGAAAVRETAAGNQILVGYVVPADGAEFDQTTAAELLRERLPAALVPLLAIVDDLPTKTSGKVDRAALPWPLSTVDTEEPVGDLSATEAWLANGWAETLGVRVTDAKADFFAHGGGSLTAAQLISRIRERYPQVSVSDVYQHPRLGALAALLDSLECAPAARDEVAPTPRSTGVWQLFALLPMLLLPGMRLTLFAAALSNLLHGIGGFAWAPTTPWWLLAGSWLVLCSPPGRVGIAAGGARLLLRGIRPGSYPRGGRVHRRLWAAEQLADRSGVGSLGNACWLTYYAKALGAKVAKDVDLHSPPPVTGMLRVGKGAAVEPEVDLAGHWVDGNVVHIGKVRIGAGARVGARATLLPGARIGKGAEVVAGSVVTRSVPAGQRWAGAPAVRVAGDAGKAGPGWPQSRPRRSRAWLVGYAVSATLLGALPAIAGIPALVLLLLGLPSGGGVVTMTGAALLAVPLATVVYLVTFALLVLLLVRALSIGMAEGYHPVHSRHAWQVWATVRLMDMARIGLFPLYASAFTPVWLRLLGARIGRDVEASTVLAVPKMTKVTDGAFLADDTMVATYELGGGWLHIAPARVGKQAFLGNSGMTAPGRSVPKRGLVGVLSAAPDKAKKGSSWLGMPPMPLRRAATEADEELTFRPPRRLKIARGVVELCRVVPVMCAAALAVLAVGVLIGMADAVGFWATVLLSPLMLSCAGVCAGLLTAVAKWLLVGRFRSGARPLWCSFIWRTELADTFVEVLAVPWLVGAIGGTPLLPAWLRTMGARIGRGVWLETYWLPESDLVRLADGAVVNRGCVVQTHLFHDRVMRMDTVELDAGATLGPHGIVLPGASIGARTTVGPGSLVTRGDAVPADSCWLGNPIATWSRTKRRPGRGQ
ncbi:non-ribosomal peptide synthetase-like protein [Tamaricihabitans halophyticus]|uniref:Non-ribosomal peptide synthetase-like protein n=1 Tax=Tamaricihabitans halophyticus TaxID=1262583 RepID=A0A4R2QXH5_9PSEU|nr:Pls/PosA family non-ribosomal peptide synthetase [Tamaricihabitans halophyticus]TCP51855.1 non-ribosomal peptide synthetase-like protein [Tamaricihabitans halophyticus]